MRRHGNDPAHGEPRNRTDSQTSPSRAIPDPSADHPTEPALHPDRFEVRVPTPQDGDIVVDVRSRRTDVVQRLLSLGVSHCTLAALLPEWSDLISRVAADQGRTAGSTMPADRVGR